MPLPIIRPSAVEVHIEYRLHFNDVDRDGSGFAFHCDESGTVDVASLPPAAQANYAMCLANPAAFKPPYIGKCVNRWRRPALARCYCEKGEVILAYSEGNACPVCSREYNLFGQELDPSRADWERDLDPDF